VAPQITMLQTRGCKGWNQQYLYNKQGLAKAYASNGIRTADDASLGEARTPACTLQGPRPIMGDP